MSARRGSGPRPGLLVLLGLGALAVPAFGLGLLGGLLWEEPDLVVGYALGRTVPVPWGAGDEPAPDEVASTEELPAVAAPREVEEPVRAEPSAPAPQPVAAARPAEGRFRVQVGAFAEKSGASRLAGELREKGYPVEVRAGEGDARWRVRVGPFRTREEGERTAARLQREERLPTWVLEEEP